MIYILIALIGIIVGMLIIITFNAINENVKEKQYLKEYKKIIEVKDTYVSRVSPHG